MKKLGNWNSRTFCLSYSDLFFHVLSHRFIRNLIFILHSYNGFEKTHLHTRFAHMYIRFFNHVSRFIFENCHNNSHTYQIGVTSLFPARRECLCEIYLILFEDKFISGTHLWRGWRKRCNTRSSQTPPIHLHDDIYANIQLLTRFPTCFSFTWVLDTKKKSHVLSVF